VGEMRNLYNILVKNLKEKDCLKNLGIDDRTGPYINRAEN
jgi:hypothetical protein